MAALRRRGLTVGASKVGPDYIDPGYHRLATGRPSRNLDAFLSPARLIGSLAARAGSGTDVLVIEGVMGLFDGAHEPARPGNVDGTPPGLPLASTAAVAVLTSTPVILVVDASAMSQSVAAVVHGYASWSPSVHLRGVILNQVGSDAHEDSLRRSLEPLADAGIRVLGALRRDPALVWRDRHLGLVPVAERPGDIQTTLASLADAIDRFIELDEIMTLASTAPALDTPPLPATRALPAGGGAGGRGGGAGGGGGGGGRGGGGGGGGGGRRPRIAVAGGPAFTFVYPDNLERLEEAGAELVPVDPINDAGLPEGTDGLYAGGGFPEVYAEELSGNREMLAHVSQAARAGMPVWAECGGLLWLAASLDGKPLCGVVPASGAMTQRLTLGYRTATVRTDNPVATAGTTLRGHEFHYSRLDPPGDALSVANHRQQWLEGYATASMLATYLHMHLGAEPGPAEGFVSAAAAWRAAAAR
jgi:cobyrinic acid a,c-diamide synthase